MILLIVPWEKFILIKNLNNTKHYVKDTGPVRGASGDNLHDNLHSYITSVFWGFFPK